MEAEKLISHRQRIEQDTFFARMEEFGFFDTVEEHLPQEFTAVFEIARVLENPEHFLGEQLAPVIMMTSREDTIPDETPSYIPTLLPGEEYEADLIRNVQELPAIYPHQFLLPENVFYQKLVERSLWLPRPHPPQNYRYQAESDTFKPDHRKQKVYVLFDTSRSMNMHYRIHLAKAIAYLFLRRNMKELGTVYFRTFDAVVGELQTANDAQSFSELLSTLMHMNAEGRGTVLNKAILQALEDIRSLHNLHEAEILVITDGAAHIELAKVRELMGSSIKINTVKIGDERITADAKFVQYHLNDANTEDAKKLKQLINRKHDVEVQLNNASGTHLQNKLRQEIAALEKQINLLTERVSKYISEHYGNEIAELCEIYVQVEDISKTQFQYLPEEHRRELIELSDSLLHVLKEEHNAEDVKRAAILYDHLELFLKNNDSNELNELRKKHEEFQQLFQRLLASDGDDDIDDIHLSSMDHRQLLNILEPSVSNNPLALGKIIRALVKKVKKWIVERKRLRMAQVFLQRKRKKSIRGISS